MSLKARTFSAFLVIALGLSFSLPTQADGSFKEALDMVGPLWFRSLQK